MSYGLLNYDWMMSVKEKPWHGIGTVVEEAPTSEEAIRIAKLDWTVQQFPVYANNEPIEGYFANIRSDINLPLGIVKGRYRIVQNSEAFGFVDNIIGNKDMECRYETAGSLFNGKRIFLLVKLPDKDVLGDKIENYMFFTNSHDGSKSLMAGVSSVRVVCNNTLQLAIKNAERLWVCRHTVSIQDKVFEAKASLGMAVTYMNGMSEVAEDMYAIKIDSDTFFKRLAESPTMVSIAEKNRNLMIERMRIISKEKDDLVEFKGTGWGMYNAVADYISNAVPLRRSSVFEEKKLASFFDGNKLLDESQKIIMSA